MIFRLYNESARFDAPPSQGLETGSTMSITIGVSLKAYLGYRDTLLWASAVAEIARSRSNPSIELFVLPAFPALAPVRDILTGSGVLVGGQDIAADDAGNQTGEVTEPCWPTPAATMPRSDTRNAAGNSARREGRRGQDRGRPAAPAGPSNLPRRANASRNRCRRRRISTSASACAGRRSVRHAGRPGRGRV